MELLSRALAFSALAVVVLSHAGDGQSPVTIAAGFGWGFTSLETPDPSVADMVMFADAKWPVTRAAKVGVEVWRAFNNDRICLTNPGDGACRRISPTFVGVAPTISTKIGDAIEVGFGPGLFQRSYSSDEKALIGGAVAHVNATMLHSRYFNVLLSVRPFAAPASNGRVVWVVPFMLGISH